MEATLRERGKTEQLDQMEAWLPAAGQLAFTRQQRPLGLGHAVWCARNLVGNEPFAVILVDDLMSVRPSPPCLKQMVDAYERTGGNIVAVIEVPRAETRRYGVLDIVSDDGRLARAKGVVEKPAPEEAPSTLTIIGRYIIQPEIFYHLSRVEPGVGNEIQLTDGLAGLIADGQDFHGLRTTGRRYDCGDKLGFLEANLALGLDHPELGPRAAGASHEKLPVGLPHAASLRPHDPARIRHSRHRGRDPARRRRLRDRPRLCRNASLAQAGGHSIAVGL